MDLLAYLLSHDVKKGEVQKYLEILNSFRLIS